jgi:hypothetical protein
MRKELSRSRESVSGTRCHMRLECYALSRYARRTVINCRSKLTPRTHHQRQISEEHGYGM